MIVCEWLVETIVCKSDYSYCGYSFTIETISNSKKVVFDIAKLKTKEELKKDKQDYERINICWIELKKSYRLSKYQRFVRLKESNRPRKAISNILNIPFWKLREYEEYYNGNTKPLTIQGYFHLRKFLTDEQIRRRYKIPRCEFNQFLKSVHSCSLPKIG
ncbi:hypothetical protein P0E64_08830 [Enterococcus faecalis]|uniref:hypothetical protein n=1 Tax=Enterococcus TaxID=1350 RepID=UPI00192679B9|nr:hypothetical protein [Enterococcus faecalis]EGO7931071.1 hypothetical protein [Enterococcus faecalis]MDN3125214.1 hypothetical protein [Enterococcus faecalis]MDT2225171.1 hypothetical protein [Enterococcus faecalis]